jgi:hypothetical protein
MNHIRTYGWLQKIAFAISFVGVGVVLSFGVLAAWMETYPDAADPKNIYYVLWKHRLNNNMDIDSALAIMTHDVWPARQVRGLNKQQLRERFGYIHTLDETTPYLRACYSTAGGVGEAGVKKEDVVFLRDSPWMVVIRNEKAVDLILCKGF